MFTHGLHCNLQLVSRFDAILTMFGQHSVRTPQPRSLHWSVCEHSHVQILESLPVFITHALMMKHFSLSW